MSTAKIGRGTTKSSTAGGAYGSASVALAAHLVTLVPDLESWHDTAVAAFNIAFAVLIAHVFSPLLPTVAEVVGAAARWTGRFLIAPLQWINFRWSVSVNLRIGKPADEPSPNDDKA